MPYSNCPRCGLSIRRRDPSDWIRDCPRCLGRAGIAVPMYLAARRAFELTGIGERRSAEPGPVPRDGR